MNTNTTILITVGIVLALVPVALILSTRSLIARIAAVLFALGFAGFCGFGFLASFELPSSQRLPWQLAYALLGIGSLATSAFLLLRGGARHNGAGGER